MLSVWELLLATRSPVPPLVQPLLPVLPVPLPLPVLPVPLRQASKLSELSRKDGSATRQGRFFLPEAG